jgi:hypothetical protein
MGCVAVSIGLGCAGQATSRAVDDDGPAEHYRCACEAAVPWVAHALRPRATH